jgi:ADP-L-glycero-D-manno-heptose 6-epimerase
VGTGETRTFKDLAASAFKTMNMKEKISYIDTPQAIRASYQYYTKAEMDKLKSQISGLEFISIEEGIEDYIKNYLVPRKYFR